MSGMRHSKRIPAMVVSSSLQTWTKPSVMLSPNATNLVATRCGGFAGGAGATAGVDRDPQPESTVASAATVKALILKTALDRIEERVGNLLVPGLGWMESV